MSRTDTKDELAAGAVIDNRYEVVSLLGSGGFANVYKARHVHLDRDVALKVLHPPLTATEGPNAAFSQRFEQEARIAAGLDHPNVVAIFDYGFLPSDEPYIAMSYLDGHDLEEELTKNGPLEPERALRLMTACLEGVAHGHERGVVHKDLKPSNLFLVNAGKRDERLVVLDFGIARVFTDPDAKITQSGLFSGTPAYLAPEYIREQHVSPAVDVYQLGLILIEMLTGRPAIEADGPMGYLLAHCMGRLAVDPSFFDGELGDACLKALSVDPALRYQDAGEFADALTGVEIPETINVTAERPRPSSISQEEVEAFARTLPESLLADTAEWSEQVAEPNVTPRQPAGQPTVEQVEPPPAKPDPKPTQAIEQAPSKKSLLPALLVVLGLLAVAIVTTVVVGSGDEVAPKAPPESPPAANTTGMVFVLDEKPDPAMEVARSLASTRVGDALRDAREAEDEFQKAASQEPTVKAKPKPKPKPKPQPKPAPKPDPEPKPEPEPADDQPLIGY